ncbi:MAG: tetratricopeptide repeat protein [Bacteroidales bacterium]
MNQLEEVSKRIADYLYDDMDASERLAFEKDMDRDESLAQEFRFQRKMVRYLRSNAREEALSGLGEMGLAERILEERLATHPTDFHVTQADRDRLTAELASGTALPKARTGRNRVLLSALAVAAGLSLFLLLRNVWTDPTDRLYNQFYEPLHEASFVSRGEGFAGEATFANGVELYAAGSYEVAGMLFEKLLAQHPEHEASELFLALSLMGDREYAAAASHLEHSLTHFQGFDAEAGWYLALCYVKLGETGKSRELLQALSSEEGILGDKARKLARRLPAS